MNVSFFSILLFGVWVCCGRLVIPEPHFLAGSYELNRYLRFGPQQFANVSLPLVILSDVAVATQFCFGNVSALAHLRGKFVGIIFPFYSVVNPFSVFARGGCSTERMIAFAAQVGVAGFLTFQPPISSDIYLMYWHSCKNCSIFTRQPVTFLCLSVNTPKTYPYWNSYVRRGNLSVPPSNETMVQLEGPDRSAFEVTNESWGYAFQGILSVWALINSCLCVMFLIGKTGNRKASFLVVFTLLIELFCNLWRFSFLVVDPWVTNGFYSQIYFTAIGGFVYSVSLCATLFIALFWAHCVFWSTRQLEMRLVPLLAGIVGSFLLLASEFVPRVLTAYDLDYRYGLEVFFIVQCVSHFVLATFFLVSGSLVLWRKRSYAAVLGAGPREWSKGEVQIARFLVLESLMLYIVAGFSAIFFHPDFLFPWIFFPGNIVLGVFYSFISSLQILVFADWSVLSPRLRVSHKKSFSGTTDSSESIRRACCCWFESSASKSPPIDSSLCDQPMEEQFVKSSVSIDDHFSASAAGS